MKAFGGVLIAAVLFGSAFYAPHYLTYSDSPKISDTVILMVGPDYNARKKEAHHLIKDGYARYLIIPAHGRILKDAKVGELLKLKPLKKKRANRRPPCKHADLYENTHLEMLYAKRMMDVYGLKSAIFVSSPHHMRRIKIIGDRIFDRRPYVLSFIPTRYQKSLGTLWWTNRGGLNHIIGEYIKIGWFLLYEPFVEN